MFFDVVWLYMVDFRFLVGATDRLIPYQVNIKVQEGVLTFSFLFWSLDAQMGGTEKQKQEFRIIHVAKTKIFGMPKGVQQMAMIVLLQ